MRVDSMLQSAISRLPKMRGVAAQKLANQILVELGLGMTRGQYLTNAPSGTGGLISGGYDADKAAFIVGKREQNDEDGEQGDLIKLADGRLAPLRSGRRAAPKGWGSHKDEETGTIRSQFAKLPKKVKISETDSTFIDQQYQDKSILHLDWERLRWFLPLQAVSLLSKVSTVAFSLARLPGS